MLLWQKWNGRKRTRQSTRRLRIIVDSPRCGAAHESSEWTGLFCSVHQSCILLRTTIFPTLSITANPGDKPPTSVLHSWWARMLERIVRSLVETEVFEYVLSICWWTRLEIESHRSSYQTAFFSWTTSYSDWFEKSFQPWRLLPRYEAKLKAGNPRNDFLPRWRITATCTRLIF